MAEKTKRLTAAVIPFREINEKLLQYIWQFKYFSSIELKTTTGEDIIIISPGVLNNNQGPDFLEAKIKIGEAVFYGSVELHLKTSDWDKHKHQDDPNYRNVILHVVYQNDVSGHYLPVLELEPRISTILLEKYAVLMNTTSFIPCSQSIKLVKDITWTSWKDRLLAERLTRKSDRIFELLSTNNYHWEEVFWWMIARNFGIKVNADTFENIAKSIPLNILAKHKYQIHQLEGLLFGQANLLNTKFNEDYPKLLQREYKFLKEKYKLISPHTNVQQLRMRPSNLPTVRLAQLAMVVHQSDHLFAKVLDKQELDSVKKMLNTTANDYWHYHYVFDQAGNFKPKSIGEEMVNNIIINTIVPILFAYGIYHKREDVKNKAIRWLEELSSEHNSIIDGFKQLQVDSRSAFDSQALIELKNEYCQKKRCLSCGVGTALLKS